jgi:hypothetical protein
MLTNTIFSPNKMAITTPNSAIMVTNLCISISNLFINTANLFIRITNPVYKITTHFITSVTPLWGGLAPDFASEYSKAGHAVRNSNLTFGFKLFPDITACIKMQAEPLTRTHPSHSPWFF